MATPTTSPAKLSFLHRLSNDATHAAIDVYSSWVLGDDAGKSVRLTFLVKAHIDMTFIEINGRAYVKTVTPQSAAALAGILPQDAVQYALPLYPDETEPQARDRLLHQEERGMRISYDELRRLVTPLDPSQSAFLSPTSPTSNRASGMEIPGCIPSSRSDVRTEIHDDNIDAAAEAYILCFRRTRQRKAMPFWSFRLDDECDFASRLVQRLAPTHDMETPTPDTWEELVHEGTDWLLGNGSMLPPRSATVSHHAGAGHAGTPHGTSSAAGEEDLTIPLDDMERERSRRLALLRSRMAAEAMLVDRTDDVEAVTIRGMIQKAVGLAFVRASKVVLGVSVHGGSGIVLARLSDGTWSAPSAIGTWGLGLGIQFGLEVAEYIFILQTAEALDHFRRGGSFTVGGNLGAAVAGVGREAYGAASVGGAVCGGGAQTVVKDDEYNNDEFYGNNANTGSPNTLAIAPIVAYAKSQGLYVGVSLEGSRIFTRDDLNRRAYKFSAGRDVTSFDILTGKVATPPEAEELYAALHSVEFTHEMSCLPRPPEVLRRDSSNGWSYHRCTLSAAHTPFEFLEKLTREEAEECQIFETQFKEFMYGGVSVQRLIPSEHGRTGRERRTLWLMLPEVGSLRLGFVSKLSDGETVSNKSSTLRARQRENDPSGSRTADHDTVGSEEVTLDSALRQDSTAASQPQLYLHNVKTGNVQLSRKHSVALTSVTLVTQEPKVNIRLKGDDRMEHLRVISIQDTTGTCLLFLANNFREAELLVCGLKLLLERETSRLGLRGGMGRQCFGRGALHSNVAPPQHVVRDNSDVESVAGGSVQSHNLSDDHTWGSVPGRHYMRQAAALRSDAEHEGGVPQYVHGQAIAKHICKSVVLPLPLPLCRVLLLDSTSPVVSQWEADRGDLNFDKTKWAFPPATPRELERHASEHQLIASGSMCDAHRTSSFDRPRYGALVRLSETHTVEADDSSELVFCVTERNPRRGFSVKVRVSVRAVDETSCETSVTGELRPVGKDMSNQAAVHKAFLLVVDEIRDRYGVDGNGLLAGFMRVVDNMAEEKKEASFSDDNNAGVGTRREASRSVNQKRRTSSAQIRQSPTNQSKTIKAIPANSNNLNGGSSGLVSFDSMLRRNGRDSPETTRTARPSTPSLLHQIPESDPGKRVRKANNHVSEDLEQPPTMTSEREESKEPVLIEVKPLPKIRLSLMPSPREEDEDENSEASPVLSKTSKKKKKRSKKSGSRRVKQPSS